MSRSLIFADPRDIHALRVKERSEEILKHPCVVVPTALFPSSVMLTSVLDGKARGAWVEHDASCLNLDHVSGIWRRRLWRHKVSIELETDTDREISRNDSRHALEGFLHVAAQSTRTMNDPRLEAAAESKTFQLAAAAECGFRIPATCISNHAGAVRRFVAEQAARRCSVIYKTFASPSNKFVSTKLYAADDDERLADLRFAPAIFQEFVAGRDVRLTCVGSSTFPAEIHPRSEKSRVDWRIDGITEVTRLVLPDEDLDRVRRLMVRLGLTYGALDFKLTPEGELVFLEVNPWGQYLFVEIPTGLEISLAIARWLAGVDSSVTN